MTKAIRVLVSGLLLSSLGYAAHAQTAPGGVGIGPAPRQDAGRPAQGLLVGRAGAQPGCWYAAG